MQISLRKGQLFSYSGADVLLWMICAEAWKEDVKNVPLDSNTFKIVKHCLKNEKENEKKKTSDIQCNVMV